MVYNGTKKQMKKLLLVALAVLVASASFAQFSAAPKVNDMKNFKGIQKTEMYTIWEHMGTAVEGIDILSGDTIRVQDYLNEGKFVLIDFSCTWCGPCWNMHNCGLLEEVQNLDNFQVIWCEIEESNTTAQIYGPQGGSTYADATYGNWTLTPSGDTVPYPIIDDANFLTPFEALYEGYVPTMMLVAPNGMFCNLSGYYSYQQVAASLQAIQMVAASYPQAGQAPACIADGPASVLNGSAATFQAYSASFEAVTYSWTFQNGTPATATGANPTCTWNQDGTYQVILTATNNSGSASDTLSVEVYTLAGGILSYAYNQEYASGIGTGSASNVYWGASYPSTMLADYSTIDHVDVYVAADYPGAYTLTVSEGNASAPTSTLYTKTINVTAAMGDNYVTFTPDQTVSFDRTKTLWITFNAAQTYPCAGAEGTLDANGDWISTDGSTWAHASEYSLAYTWLIDTYVGNGAGIARISNDKVALYPNPTSSKVSIRAEGVKKVEVLDVNGRVVLSQNNGETVDMSNLSNGVYMFRVLTNEGLSMQKVVKK